MGAGLTLEQLRGASDERIAETLLALSASLNAAALALAEDIGTRFFTLARGADQVT
jgi:hypothetical protein